MSVELSPAKVGAGVRITASGGDDILQTNSGGEAGSEGRFERPDDQSSKAPPTCVVAFDGDDTLWSAAATQAWERQLNSLVAGCLPPADIDADILARVKANGFTIEGIQKSLRDALISNEDCGLPSGWRRRVDQLPDLAAALELRPVEGLDRVLDDVEASGRQAWIITRGGALAQALKVARLGCLARFAAVEVVGCKNRRTYRDLPQSHAVASRDFTMIGDSLFEDVIPPLILGCAAAYIPAGKARVLRPLGMVAHSERLTVCASLEQACRTISAS
jgi:FMN phosphatase YigB (HAD superfamily)